MDNAQNCDSYRQKPIDLKRHTSFSHFLRFRFTPFLLFLCLPCILIIKSFCTTHLYSYYLLYLCVHRLGTPEESVNCQMRNAQRFLLLDICSLLYSM
jgi:hypothetical protein